MISNPLNYFIRYGDIFKSHVFLLHVTEVVTQAWRLLHIEVGQAARNTAQTFISTSLGKISFQSFQSEHPEMIIVICLVIRTQTKQLCEPYQYSDHIIYYLN